MGADRGGQGLATAMRAADAATTVSAGAGRGLLVLVVGPSGVGKDTLIAALQARRPSLVVARRLITRAAGAGGEEHDAVPPEVFEQLRDAGALMLSWDAHALSYAIPLTAEARLAVGRDVVANVSRGVVAEALIRFRPCLALNLTAPRATLAARLAARGRETAEEIARRLERAEHPGPSGPQVATVDNGGAIETAVAQALAAIDAAKARLTRREELDRPA